MNLLIAGDLVPTQSNIDLFNKAKVDYLLGDKLFSLWNSSDMRIFNLEVPLIDYKSPIEKCGPNLIAPTSAINGIKKLNPAAISLANNHIFDQDVEGFNSTLETLSNNNIPVVGAGNNLYKASKPYIITSDGLKIGIYACAEHEFTIASERTLGANPFDPLESLDHIEALKEECDYVIVLYHGGEEHYRYPSPYLQKICRKMTEKGADVVVCQHSHCIGCFEKHNDSTIVYGQGNFIFDYSESEYWQTSLLINIEINNELNLKYTPIVKKENVVRLASQQEGNEILNSFYRRSEEIKQTGFVEKGYKKLAEESIASYLRGLSGMGKWISRFDRYLFKGNLLKRSYNSKQLLSLQNYIECEAHRELLIAGIKVKRSDE